jgi:hypothetical protein
VRGIDRITERWQARTVLDAGIADPIGKAVFDAGYASDASYARADAYQ